MLYTLLRGLPVGGVFKVGLFFTIFTSFLLCAFLLGLSMVYCVGVFLWLSACWR